MNDTATEYDINRLRIIERVKNQVPNWSYHRISVCVVVRIDKVVVNRDKAELREA